MDNYYIYRVNVGYDGFYPVNIYERSDRGKFVFNWRAYLDNLEEGDIVLAYFLGGGCGDGIYAVTKVEEIVASRYERNVIADILYASTDNWSPIIAKKDYKSMFRDIMYRPRGAEIILSASNEAKIIALLEKCDELTEELTKLSISLPGLSIPLVFDFSGIPLVNLKKDFASRLRQRNLASAFWIKPKQASWMKYIGWLSKISTLFYKFKSGDKTYIKEFSQKLGVAINNHMRESGTTFDLILGVPLCEEKRKQGEIDRVALLCEYLANSIHIPYLPVMKLNGMISRVSYKRLGLSTDQFIEDYLKNLSISKKGIKQIRESNRKILLVDDVLTDGVTTNTIMKFLKENFCSKDLDVHIATLGIMAKVDNLSRRLRNRWHN